MKIQAIKKRNPTNTFQTAFVSILILFVGAIWSKNSFAESKCVNLASYRDGVQLRILTFTSMLQMYHNSALITVDGKGIPVATLKGNSVDLEGNDNGCVMMQSAYPSQTSQLFERCLAVAEQLTLQQKFLPNAKLRISAIYDKALHDKGFPGLTIIKECSLIYY